MKKKSEIQKIAATEAANRMLVALDSTAEDFEKQGNIEASFQVDLARHYLKRAVEEGELDGVEVPVNILAKTSADYLIPENDVGGVDLIDDDPFESFQLEDDDDDDGIEDDMEVDGCGGNQLRAFDYNKIAYIKGKAGRKERLAKMAKEAKKK